MPESMPTREDRLIGDPPQRTVLVVDDEESVRETCRQVLELSGYKVLVAEDGIEALRIFREHSEIVACVLLDLRMPRKNGEETLNELRQLNAKLPVIMFSAYADDDTLQRLKEEGLSAFVPKPYRLDKLVSKLNGLLAPQPA
jgi:CheY-like chemotaxis protein